MFPYIIASRECICCTYEFKRLENIARLFIKEYDPWIFQDSRFKIQDQEYT